MKTRKKTGQTRRLTPDLQKRLVAYTTVAGLGTLCAGQKADAQVVESPAFAPYPATLPAPTSPTASDFPIDVTGDGTTDFEMVIFSQAKTPQAINLYDEPNINGTTGLGSTNTFLNDSSTSDSYLVCWLGGTTISGATGIQDTYLSRIAVDYASGSSVILDNKFTTAGALGFEFVSSVDGQLHFGYMDIVVNSTPGTMLNNKTGNEVPAKVITSVTVYGVYYNETPNAPISIPLDVNVLNLALGPENAVTINFTSNTNAPLSALTLETSPTLGPSANWTTDPNATITQTVTANPQHANKTNKGESDLAQYQAITIGTNSAEQYWRVVQNLSQ